MIKLLLIVGAGGFLGSISRFLTSIYIQKWFSSPFPFGTFFVNILGCFILGLIYGLTTKTNILTAEVKLFLTVGFCGGFTTFSTFSYENLTLLKDNNFFLFALYSGLSVFMGIFACFFGSYLSKLTLS